MMFMLLLEAISFAADFQIHVISSSALDEYYQSQSQKLKKIPLCDSIGEQLVGCVWGRQSESDSFQLLHLSDVKTYGTSREEIWQTAKQSMLSEVNKSRYQKILVSGTPYEYWASNAYDGYDAAALVNPHKIKQFLSGDILMAIPARGTVLFWPSGAAERDKIIAVGVYDIFNSSEVPVSPDIYKWDGERWRVWARGKEQAK